MRIKSYYLLLALLIGFTSCDEDDDSGPPTSVTHEPGFYVAIELFTSSNVTIHPDIGWRVIVDGLESDVNDTDVFVSGGTLIIRENGSIDQDQHISIFTPFLYSIKSFGSSNVSGESTFLDSTPVQIYSYGSGNIDMQMDTIDMIYIKNFGSGDIFISGLADMTNIELTGSGGIGTFLLPAMRSNIILSGSGNAEVTVANNLDVLISGSGNVYYKGHPQIDDQVTGSGKVINAN